MGMGVGGCEEGKGEQYMYMRGKVCVCVREKVRCVVGCVCVRGV